MASPVLPDHKSVSSGIVPDEIEGGHCPALSRRRELAQRLEEYWTGLPA